MKLRSGWVGMAIVTLVMVSVLLSLGFWQLQRKTEKQTLIAALTERLASDPVPLPGMGEWASLKPSSGEFRRVTFTATFDGKPDANVFSSGSALRSDVSGVGAFVFAPARLSGGGIVVVDRGFVPEGQQANAAPVVPGREMKLTGYLRFPEIAGVLTPKEDVNKRQWFVRDHRAMAGAHGWGEVAPFYIDLESPVPPSGVPKPGPMQVRLKDNHLQYAITWFGLAAVVSAAFGIWLSGQRRRDWKANRVHSL